ncbi:MAG: NUDIX hydrolase [Paracoccaceae bacterium]
MTNVDKTAIRNAATVIVLRDRHSNPQILMGQRGAKAAFMPNKFVFPGGAVDASDADVPLAAPIPAPCDIRLLEDINPEAPAITPHALAVAAIRELFEETGQVLGTKRKWSSPPTGSWHSFAQSGLQPDPSGLQYVFRALTPPGRPRRFDARFFLVDADDLASDPDDFSQAEDELSHLQWVPLTKARSFDMPFITEVVLAEIEVRVTDPTAPSSVPYFKNTDEANLFLRLYGAPQPDD